MRDYWTVPTLDGVYYGSEKEYQMAIDQLSVAPAYPNMFFFRSELIEVTDDLELLRIRLEPAT